MISNENHSENKLFVKRVRKFINSSSKPATNNELGLINYNYWLFEKYAV
jgi:hypothetical protein